MSVGPEKHTDPVRNLEHTSEEEEKSSVEIKQALGGQGRPTSRTMVSPDMAA